MLLRVGGRHPVSQNPIRKTMFRKKIKIKYFFSASFMCVLFATDVHARAITYVQGTRTCMLLLLNEGWLDTMLMGECDFAQNLRIQYRYR